MNEAIANRLAELRKAHNMSQEELAVALNISRQAVSKWERGESSPDMENLIALSNLYSISLDALLKPSESPEAAAAPAAPSPAEEASPTATKEPETYTQKEAPQEKADEDASPEDPLPNGSYYDTPQGKRDVQGPWHKVPYPILVTVIYLILGFIFHLWHPGWLIFLTVPLHYLPEKDKTPRKLLTSPVMITIIYLILGFYFNLWHPGWLIFLLVPLFGAITNN